MLVSLHVLIKVSAFKSLSAFASNKLPIIINMYLILSLTNFNKLGDLDPLLAESTIEKIPATDHCIVRTTDTYTESVYELVFKLASLRIQCVLLTSDADVKETMFRLKIKFLYYRAQDDPMLYIDTAFKMLEATTSLYIGCFRNHQGVPAGILPVIYHEGKLFMALGYDPRARGYSDFGGGFDHEYKEHAKDSYKSDALREYQIKNGFIDKLSWRIIF
jgi:rRNA-processing protein FCF1